MESWVQVFETVRQGVPEGQAEVSRNIGGITVTMKRTVPVETVEPKPEPLMPHHLEGVKTEINNVRQDMGLPPMESKKSTSSTKEGDSDGR